ncbi:uncharacterized protein METZ01_LOCUS30144 [marine metagenome]|uniref:Uncharacterized protein n=1 Tax=marine metagenome TaxID=408172 RepID=A0A381QE70_9ZZZZ
MTPTYPKTAIPLSRIVQEDFISLGEQDA